MKRAQDVSPDPQQDDASTRKPAKRQKTVQACNSCKKSKTRCEVLAISLNTPVQCHRCKVLNNPCSYAEMDRSIFGSQLAQPSASTSTSNHLQSMETAVKSMWASQPTPPPSVEQNFPRPDHLWSYVKAKHQIDWSAPLVAIQELAKQPFEPNGNAVLPPDRSLDDILSPAQKSELLLTFTLYYLPWLNFPLIRETSNPLLDLVCCTIASRHLDELTRFQVAPRLLKLTEDTVVKLIFNPATSESLESIQSLLILSLWSPICGNSESGMKDGKLLIASAVSMSMNLKINDAPTKLMQMQESAQKDPSSIDPTELDALRKEARLWSCLLNIESMICLGTARLPLSRRTHADTYFIPMSPQFPEGLEEGRDLRIRLMSELFTQSEKARTVRLTTSTPDLPAPAAVDTWYDGLASILDVMDRLQRLIAPLQIVASHENHYFLMLDLVRHCAHLLVYYFALYDARHVFNERENPTGTAAWFVQIRPHGLSVLIKWGKETLRLAEAILICVLRSDPNSLRTAPDHLFNMVGFAAGLIVGVKFLTVNKLGMELLGSTDKLLTMVRSHLIKASISPDHAASRCAQLVGAMIETWQHRDKSDKGLDYTLPPIPLNSPLPSQSSSSPESHTPSTSSTGDDTSIPLAQGTSSMGQTSDSDWLGQGGFNAFDDANDFWTSFLSSTVVDQQQHFGHYSYNYTSLHSNFQYS